MNNELLYISILASINTGWLVTRTQLLL